MASASKKNSKRNKERRKKAVDKRTDSLHSFKRGASSEQKAYGNFLIYFLVAFVLLICFFAFMNMK